MAQQDVIKDHFLAADQSTFETHMTAIETLLQARLHNLNEEENQKYGVINESNKLLVNKVLDYRNTQPALSSGDVDWTEFVADYLDRKFLETAVLRMNALLTAMTETRRLHDYDNYQNSLVDYAYTQYKNRTSPGMGYDAKEAELKQFFPGS